MDNNETIVKERKPREFLFKSFFKKQELDDQDIVADWQAAGTRHSEKYLLSKVKYFRKHIDEYKNTPVAE
jgi:hypothetical protein